MIRTISYTVSPTQILPDSIQPAGLQGEHNVTELVFTLAPELAAEIEGWTGQGQTALCRIDGVDGGGGYYASDFLPIERGEIRFPLPAALTSAGGVCRLHLTVSRVRGVDEAQIFYSYPVLLRLSHAVSGEQAAVLTGVTGALSGAREAQTAAEAAQTAAEAAQAAAEAAQTGAREAQSAALVAKEEALAARTDAQTAETGARAAETGARAAQDAALAAKAEAREAQSAAETARTGAQAAQDDCLRAQTACAQNAASCKADKAACDEAKAAVETLLADNRLTGKAQGVLAQIDGVQTGRPLLSCRILGDMTGNTGAQTPEHPATLSGVRPTKLTVCGRNLVVNEADFFGRTIPVEGSVNVDFLRYEEASYYAALFDTEGKILPITSVQVMDRNGTWLFGVNSGELRSVTAEKAAAARHSFMILKIAGSEGKVTKGLLLCKSDRAVPYEPYIGSVMPIGGGAELWGIGEVCDSLDLLANRVTRRIGSAVLSGGFVRTGEHTFHRDVPGIRPGTNAVACTHFASVTGDETGVTLTTDAFDSAEAINAWAAQQGGAVVLYFERETPAEEPCETGLSTLAPPSVYLTVYADAGQVAVCAQLSPEAQLRRLWDAVRELQAQQGIKQGALVSSDEPAPDEDFAPASDAPGQAAGEI